LGLPINDAYIVDFFTYSVGKIGYNTAGVQCLQVPYQAKK